MQADGQKGRLADRWTDWKTVGQIDKQVDRHTDKQTDKLKTDV